MSSSVKRLQIPLAEILEATNNFADENIVCDNGFGYAYKGQLFRGELISIAAWRLDRQKFGYGDTQFWKEVTLLPSLKHENIVSNIGYCWEDGECIIVNKHECNGRLDRRLHGDVTWVQRLKISVGIARALNYIHYDEGRKISIIHRMVTGESILLDENWVPKLSSFGCSKIIPVTERHDAHNDKVSGSGGSIDPVYEATQMVSHKSDVCSFGRLLFEMLVEWRLIDSSFNEKVKYHYENKTLDDLIDPDLRAQMNIKSFNLFSKTAFSCFNGDPSARPYAQRIVRALEKALKLQQEHEKPFILKELIIAAVVEDEDTSYRA